MSQSWFTLQPFKMIEGKRPALFEAFDDLQLRIKHGFDYTSDAVVAAVFGISGVVDFYDDLPDPSWLEPKTIYIVRQNVGSPSGNGLYWVQESGGAHVWEFLDALNVQDAHEVPYDNTVSGIPETDVQGAIDWLKDNGGGGGGGDTYTNPEPSVIEVGGIEVGTTFSNTTFGDFMDMLLYPELFPTFVAPSSTFALTQAGLREVGETVTLNFTTNFSRGSITPAYGTSGFRSGLPTTYTYTGTGLSPSVSSSLLSNAQTVSGYSVLVGAQDWTAKVTHLIGEQPLSSKGNSYESPYPAGDTAVDTVSITGVYPTFATTSGITTMTKASLVAMNSSYVQFNMVAESGSDKQKADLPVAWSTITGIQFYNTVSSQWEWIGGTKAASLLTFTITGTTNTVQGATINYNRYTHNGSTIGARNLRFYTT